MFELLSMSWFQLFTAVNGAQLHAKERTNKTFAPLAHAKAVACTWLLKSQLLDFCLAFFSEKGLQQSR